MKVIAQAAMWQKTSDERRAHTRYPLRLPVEFEIARHRITGSGWSADLSSGGLQIISSVPPPHKLSFGLPARILITVLWPATRDGAEIHLILRGTLVRVEGTSLGITADSYRFETHSVSAKMRGVTAERR